MRLLLNQYQREKLFDLKPQNIILNDEDNFSAWHNTLAELRTYLKINDISIINESQTMYDNKTRVHIIELPKQAIIVSCHACGNPIDVFSMYDITIQVTRL